MEQQHTPDEIRALEQVRARLHTLCGALNNMILKLQYAPEHEPLPPWQSLQNTAFELSRNLQAIQSVMTDASRPPDEPLKVTNLDFLRSAHVLTLPNFPAAQRRDMLYTMLRKKLDLPVEDWFAEVSQSAASKSEDSNALDTVNLQELWSWAPIEANKVAGEQLGLGGSDGSEDEEESESDEEEGDDDKMDIVHNQARRGSEVFRGQQQSRASITEREPNIHARKMMDLTQILPFALTGTLGNAPSIPPQSRK